MINWRVVPSGTILKDNKVFLDFNIETKEITYCDILKGCIKQEYIAGDMKFEIIDKMFKLDYLIAGSLLKIDDKLYYYIGLSKDKEYFYFSEKIGDEKWIQYTKKVEDFKLEYLNHVQKEDLYTECPLVSRSDKRNRELKGDNYYYITLFKEIYTVCEDNSEWDDKMYEVGNYFSTYKEAQDFLDKFFSESIKKYEVEEENIIVKIFKKELKKVNKDLDFLNSLYEIDTKDASEELLESIFSVVNEKNNELKIYKKEIEEIIEKEK